MFTFSFSVAGTGSNTSSAQYTCKVRKHFSQSRQTQCAIFKILTLTVRLHRSINNIANLYYFSQGFHYQNSFGRVEFLAVSAVTTQ